jgi:tetratricopeptide (TPR) repeat protein
MKNLHRLADNNFKKAKYKKALRLYLEIIKVENQNAQAYQNASLASFYLGKDDDAHKLARKALEIDSSLVLPHVALAYTYDKCGEKDKSREEARIALKMQPESADVLCCCGVTALIDGNSELATEYLEKAVTIDPSNYFAQHHLTVIYQTGNEKKLFNQALILLRLKPNARNIIKVLYISAWLHRPYYLLLLLLSGVAGLFVEPKIILVVTFLLILIYLGTGIFVAFGIDGRRPQVLTKSFILAGLIGIVGFIIYFGIITLKILVTILQ